MCVLVLVLLLLCPVRDGQELQRDGVGGRRRAPTRVDPRTVPPILPSWLGHRHRRRSVHSPRARTFPCCLFTLRVFDVFFCSGHIYIAPSGVQKERMRAADLFVMTPEGEMVRELCPAPERCLIMSQCTPLFFNAYNLRNAGTVFNTYDNDDILMILSLSIYPSICMHACVCLHMCI